MKKIILLAVIFAATCCFTSLHAGARARVGVEVGGPVYPYGGYTYDDNYAQWNGPGVYYGVWVGNEIEFYNRRRHHHHYRRQYRRNYHRHGHYNHNHPHHRPHYHY